MTEPHLPSTEHSTSPQGLRYIQFDDIDEVSLPDIAPAQPEALELDAFHSVSPREHDYGGEGVDWHRDGGAEIDSDYAPDLEHKLGSVAANFLYEEEVTSNPEKETAAARDHLAVVRKKSREEYNSTMEQLGLDPNEPLSDEAIARFYKHRLGELDSRTAERYEQLEGLKGEFMNALNWAAKRGLPVDLARAKRRVDALEIKLFDGALIADDKSAPVGLFDKENDYAYIAHEVLRPGQDEREIKRIMFHEFIHGLAGMRMVEAPGKIAARQRMGLKTYPLSRYPKGEKEPKAVRYDWIDEAVTERLARILLTYDMPALRRRQRINFKKMTDDQFFYGIKGAADMAASAFSTEQHVLSRILSRIPDKKRPLQTLLGAYFEDYEPYNPSEQRQPLRSKLFRMMDSVVNISEIDTQYDQSKPQTLQDAFETTYKKDHRWIRDGGHRGLHRAVKRVKRHEDRKRTKQAIAEWRERDAA